MLTLSGYKDIGIRKLVIGEYNQFFLKKGGKL